MATHVPCKKNDASGYVFYVSLVSQADTKVFQANPTYAAGDIQVAVDDNAPANVDGVQIDGDWTKRVRITLSQAQTNGDNLTVICSDAAGDEWCDLTINIQTSAQTLDEIDVNVDDVETLLGVVDGKVDTIDGEIATIDGEVGDLATAVGVIDGEIATIDTNVDDIETHTTAIDGHIQADYGATEKSAIDLLDDAAYGLVAVHTDHFGNLDASIQTCDTAVDAVKTVVDAITAAGPTKAEMDTGHGLLATEAKQDIISTNVDDIEADTNEIQISLADGGFTDLLIDAIKAETALIVADTNEVQVSLADGGFTDLLIDAIKAVTDVETGVKAAVNALENISTANVNTEMVDVLSTDTIAELGVAAPAITPTLTAAIMLLYMALKNKLDIDADWKEVHKDDGTLITKKALTDAAGVYSEAKMESG